MYTVPQRLEGPYRWGVVSADMPRRASSPEVSRALNPRSPDGGDHPEAAEIRTLGEGEGAQPAGAEPRTDGPGASHDTGPRTRSGARVSERAAYGEKRVPAQSLDRRAREHGQDGRVEEGPTSKAAG